MKLSVEGKEFQVEVAPGRVVVDGEPVKVEVKESSGPTTELHVEGRPYRVEVVERTGADVVVAVDGKTYKVSISGLRALRTGGAGRRPEGRAKGEEEAGVCKLPLLDGVLAVMPGRILSVKVKDGETVKAGTVLCILEAMKMENEIRAAKDGVVTNIRVTEGSTVNRDDLLMQVC